ncbi:MAG: metalloregulator ArsR/SmtB family transcription factor [Ktedonobacterales bacterium]|nr:metalloregulator ArsR/SmtB family transcription factor [Ktedonobacterales bacterium]
MQEDTRALLLLFFRALADETRLRMIGLLATHERSVEELATLLDLRMPTISHHLAKLREAGLVTMRRDGNTHHYALDSEHLHARSRELLTPATTRALAEDTPGEAWERKIIHDFFEGERLKEIPASRKKRDVILRWFAQHFAADEAYTEAQVNGILGRHHDDVATLRREMVGAHLLRREGGIYHLAELL